jgi:hypothetical protein
MARLYIANTSKQDQVIHFRLDFDQNGQQISQAGKMPKQQEVKKGRQANIGGDLPMPTIDSIVEQLRPYGLIGVADVPRQASIVPFVFNVDRPVSADVMRQVIAFNDGISVSAGQKRRQNAAIATNDLVQKLVDDLAATAGAPLPTPINDPEKPAVEFEQIEQSENGERRIEEGYILDPNAGRPSPEPNRSAKRRQKAA